MLDELIRSLRAHGNPGRGCAECQYEDLPPGKCTQALCRAAAAAIEELRKQAEEVV